MLPQMGSMGIDRLRLVIAGRRTISTALPAGTLSPQNAQTTLSITKLQSSSGQARLRPPDKCLGGPADFFGDARFGGNKLRGEPGEQADQIVRHEDLSVAAYAGADADRRNLQRRGDL